jgi:chemotaxis protein CheX
MDVSYLNPFLSATIDIFRGSFGLTPVNGEVYICKETYTHRWDISAVMVLKGQVLGVVAIRLTRLLGDKLLSLSGVTYNSAAEREEMINGLVGELMNMISGNAATRLAQYQVEISVPIVVQGKNHSIAWPSQTPIVAIPFSTAAGPFEVSFSLMELPKAYSK